MIAEETRIIKRHLSEIEYYFTLSRRGKNLLGSTPPPIVRRCIKLIQALQPGDYALYNALEEYFGWSCDSTFNMCCVLSTRFDIQLIHGACRLRSTNKPA